MKKIILIFLIALVFTSCMVSSDADMLGSPSGPSNPPFPRIESIMPLENNNLWKYSFSAYDTISGERLYSQDTIEWKIKNTFGLSDTGTIHDLEYKIDSITGYWSEPDSFPEYVYTEEWEGINEGTILIYKDQNIEVDGIYIYGTWTHTTINEYEIPQLWLKYPAQKGDAWSFNTFNLNGDSTFVIDMELISINEKFGIISEFGDGTPIKFIECYLYKETYNNHKTYYYYNSNYGMLGYSEYVGDKLYKTCYLLEFNVGGNNDYYW